MDRKEFNFEMKVDESHLDSFGHVNNAVYLPVSYTHLPSPRDRG